MKNLSILDEAKNAATSFAERVGGLFSPTVRLGVTGLSRAGKTVFITALVHTLLNAAPLPLFEPLRAGRIRRVWLQPHPDAHVPRFAYEEHIAALTAGADRRWPQSTRQIAQLRLVVDYEPAGWLGRNLHGGRLNIDIVDYPGEWLLDLPLLDMDFAEWSAAALTRAAENGRAALAQDWLAFTNSLDDQAPFDEQTAQQAAKLYRDYLLACRDHPGHFSALQPGRFLMPGDLAGSPLLTFAPLPAGDGPLWREMRRRYDAYVARVARPFFYDHFARIDRQLVLVDALTALNGGAAAVKDLKAALTSVLACFRAGSSGLFSRRAERILFAATRADLIHHSQHDRLKDILALLVEEAARQATFHGARIETEAIAALRATREGEVTQGGDTLPVIIGVPEKGERIAGKTFDGKTEAAIFPGDLPAAPHDAVSGALEGHLNIVHFRPPPLERPKPLGALPAFPHIRLDAALQFLIADDLT
ncbi:MAG TPA: YcjX family protein [Thermopetrobacter sp.]|nr:YcjX family protein [Thermopetrobacter sp.]